MNNIKNTIKWAANMKECEICMEYKYLKPFCGKHSSVILAANNG